MIANFSHLSPRNKGVPTRIVSVMNGMEFRVLALPKKELLKAANILYLHIHRESLRCYLGITVMTAQMRWGTGNPYRNNPRFGNAIRKYGWDAFESYVIAFGEDRKSLEHAEIEAIALAGGHKSKYTYNMSPGGDAVADTGKPIVGVNLSTGQSVKFKSSSEAARELDLGDSDRPSSVARGEIKSTKGWWFRFEDDLEAMPPKIWGENARVDAVKELHGKKVIAINLKTGAEQSFRTTGEAAKALGMTQSVVSMVALGKVQSAKDWWFKYEEREAMPPSKYGSELIREKRDKKVFATNLATGERKSFRNCTVADHELNLHKGASAAVCSKSRVSAGGWWFSYDQDELVPEDFGYRLLAKARSKAVVAINVITKEEHRFSSAKEAAECLGMSRSAISKVIAGEKAATKGYSFRFA